MNPIGDRDTEMTVFIKWWARIMIWAYRWGLNLRMIKPDLNKMEVFIDWLFDSGGVKLEDPYEPSKLRRVKRNN